MSDMCSQALSYVMGPLFEMLQDIGYTDATLKAAPYDWRVPPSVLQSRDGYFSKVKVMVEEMKQASGRRVVLLGHSLGTRCVHYFLRWVEREFGRPWIQEHVDTFLAVGPIFLGAPKTLRAMVTGERMGLEAFLFPEEGRALNRLLGSIPCMCIAILMARLRIVGEVADCWRGCGLLVRQVRRG
jgi:phospholipid:diacylglycerol acyltransferase